MKTPDEVVESVAKRLGDTWHLSILAEYDLPTSPPVATSSRVPDAPGSEDPVASGSRGGALWPRNVPLGRPSSAQIAANFGAHVRALHQWRDWSATHGVSLVEEARSIAGTPQRLPVRIVVPDIDTAAALVGYPWPQQLRLARARTAALLDEFPQLRTHPALPRTLRSVVSLNDLDFDILRQVATWFAQHPAEVAHGLTPRQVPLPGVHAKWLNKNQSEVATLADLDRGGSSGRNALGLLPGHPPRVHFTYLDPAYLASGRRRHDSYSVGDAVELPYDPTLVVISENKDTAVGFPPVPGGIAVEGAGTGGGTIAAVPWVRDAPLVVYWGDMDAEGLAILNEFRATGLDVTSMLMSVAAYRTYEPFGTNHAPNGQPLKVAKRALLPNLLDPERELYELLLSGQAPYLRVEQERIPLTAALAALRLVMSGPSKTVTSE